MKLTEIIKKYPRSYRKFENDYYDYILLDDNRGYKLVSNRMMYDFFDKHKIFVFIIPCNDNMFMYHINHNNLIDREQPFVNRKDAEKEAFLKAFEILEERL
jgi:hypothetical protein